MKGNYYVLGKKDNEIVATYLEKYYEQLNSMLSQLSQSGILTQEIDLLLPTQNRDFVLNPDNSSIIELLYKERIQHIPQYLGDTEAFENTLKNEIRIFLGEGYESLNLTMNKGRKIMGTNIKLTHIDNNPYNVLEAHPEHKKVGAMSGNWGEKTEEQWGEVYEKTFALLRDVDEGTYFELNQIIKKIVPLGTSRSMHNSASYKECIGHLYMGYTVDSEVPEVNNLEAIIHESSHNKLNLIMHFDMLILNDYSEKYYSPYRPDPRHIHGIYLGLHAFAPTIYIVLGAYLKGMIPSGSWGEKIALYHVKNKIALRVLEKYTHLTPLGYQILGEMRDIMSLTDKKIKELNISQEVLSNLQKAAKSHFSNVIGKNKHILY